MITRLIVEERAAPGGKMIVYIISRSRDELLSLVSELAKKPWHGRIIFYDEAWRGGVDLQINGDAARGCASTYCLQTSRSLSWDAGVLLSGPGLEEAVKSALFCYPLKVVAAKADEMECLDHTPSQMPQPAPPSPVTPRACASGQLLLY